MGKPAPRQPVAALALLFFALPGCAGGGSTASGASDDDAHDADFAASDAACAAIDADAGARLFGAPSSNTGLSAEQCGPSCGCFSARAWSPAELDALRARVLDDAPSAPAVDPYSVATLDVAPAPAGSVCAVLPGADGHYRLQGYASASQAEAAGGFVTHAGRCGLCSSLADLAVYAGSPDLTAPVRNCGLQGMAEGHAVNVACLEKLGFSPPCAAIWAYNTTHTRTVCLQTCLAELKSKHHLPDGSLNPCIACDEEQSGPVFKAVAGRTRRNSGLPSGLCRPCESVAPIAHDDAFLDP